MPLERFSTFNLNSWAPADCHSSSGFATSLPKISKFFNITLPLCGIRYSISANGLNGKGLLWPQSVHERLKTQPPENCEQYWPSDQNCYTFQSFCCPLIFSNHCDITLGYKKPFLLCRIVDFHFLKTPKNFSIYRKWKNWIQSDLPGNLPDYFLVWISTNIL